MTEIGIGVWVVKIVAVGENARKVLRKIADPRENENPRRHHRNFSAWEVLGGAKKDGLQEFLSLVCRGWVDVQNGKRIEIELQDGVRSGEDSSVAGCLLLRDGRVKTYRSACGN